jgi:hypothetical protein
MAAFNLPEQEKGMALRTAAAHATWVRIWNMVA